MKSDVAAAVGDKLQLHSIDELVTEKIDNAPVRISLCLVVLALTSLQPNPPKGSDLAVLMYTSGTTGMPKAVMQVRPRSALLFFFLSDLLTRSYRLTLI